MIILIVKCDVIYLKLAIYFSFFFLFEYNFIVNTITNYSKRKVKLDIVYSKN